MKAEDIIDFSATVNPYSLPPEIIKCFNAEQIASYPDSQCFHVINALQKYYSLPEKFFTVNIGTSEIIYIFPHLFKRPLQFGPTYGDYQDAFTRLGRTMLNIDYPVDLNTLVLSIDKIRNAGADLLIICSPNNPDGKRVLITEIEMLCKLLPETVICIDESFQEMSYNCETCMPLISEYSNLLILKSFTKPFGLGGLRAGYAAGSSQLIQKIRNFSLPWGVSTIAQRIIPLLFEDIGYFKSQWLLLLNNRDSLCDNLTNRGLHIIKSVCPFFLLNVGDSEQVRQHLLKDFRIAVRSCSSFGYPELLRIMPGDKEKNQILLNALSILLL
jgi:histidinol-phosphate/aromatic aminotransferase/cobyric acid decarboxylase-like protein